MLGLPGPEWEWAHQVEKLLGRPWSLPGSSPTWVLLAHTELVWEGPAGVCSEWSGVQGAPLIVWEQEWIQRLHLCQRH